LGGLYNESASTGFEIVNGVIVIEGDTSRVLAALRRLKDHLSLWEDIGYEGFQPDEEWVFEAVGGRSCPRCLALDGHVYFGDEVARAFPYNVPVSLTEVSANLHENCGCRLRWRNVKEVLQSRLHRRLSVVRE
jgi:hypothetical protein